MNLLIIGAGRMGIRHCMGAMGVPQIKQIFLVDITQKALDQAKKQLESDNQLNTSLHFFISGDFEKLQINCDIAVISSTVKDRITTCQLAISKGCSNLLVEKPLGQSKAEADKFIEFANASPANIAINLNMRLYDCFKQLKEDLNNLPQLIGKKVITINTGSIGIGGNGIHYLDLLYFLLNATRSELVYGEVEEKRILSGRGPEFEDYGGWCTIKFYDDEDNYLGRAHLSFTAESSVFGGWDIVAPHGQVRINEVEQSRIDILRKQSSTLPIYRYAGDYLAPEVKEFAGPFLGDLTKKWVKNIINGKQILPSVNESVKTHHLLFEWLSLNQDKKISFSIT